MRNNLQFLIWIISHQGFFALMILTAIGVSNPLLRRIKFHSPLERFVYTLAVGFGIIGYLLFLLGLAGLLYREVIITGTIIGSFFAFLTFIHSHRGRWKESLHRWKETCRPKGTMQIGLVFCAAGFWLLLLLLTQYPPMNWDATMYHLVLSRQYLIEHQITPQTGVVFPVLPILNHLLFTWALALKDDILAQMLEHLFLVLTALGLYAWGSRKGGAGIGLLAAVFWLGHPLVLWLSESAYVDLGVTCFALLGITALRNFHDEGSNEWWQLGLVLLALAAGVKISGLVFLAIGAWFGVWAGWRSRLMWRNLAQGWMLAGTLAIPWYAFIAWHTGNPVWPTFSQFSHGVWADGSVARLLSAFTSAGVPKTPLNFLFIPFYLVFKPFLFMPDNRFTLFPLIAAWPLAWILSWREASIRWWSLWGIGFTLFWFGSSQQMRLWVPALPVVGLAICESFAWVFANVRRFPIPARLVGSIFVSLALAFSGMWMLSRLRARGKPPLHAQARESYLAMNWRNYRALQFVNEHADSQDAVSVINSSWLCYYFKPRVVDSAGLLQLKFSPIFKWPEDQLWIKSLEEQNVKWIFINREPPFNNISQEIWPEYKLVYSDTHSLVFHHQTGQ